VAPVRDGSTNFSPARVYVSQDADDRALVRTCLDGDRDAFGAIVERYQRVLFTVAVRMLGNRDDANDATQNAFVKAYQHLRSFDPGRRFFSWIYRILVNECQNQMRDRRPVEPLPPDLAVGDSPADALDAEERRRRVQSAIVALPPDYREVIVLRHFGELSYDEIADALGVTTEIVKSRLHTARQRLSRMLVDERGTR
jgi:RNA polymerase sigma-70 factor (ECF subfamily)